MNSPRTVTHDRRKHTAGRPLLAGIGLALGLGLLSASPVDASTYRVYTSSAANSMVLNAGDGFCSLAEAVEHAKGLTNYNCTDFAPGSSEQRIELLESAGKPFSTNHFKITTLTLNRQGIRIRIYGSGGFIDSTATASAFVIPFKSIGFFERVTLTNTAGSAGGRLVENYGSLGFDGVTFTKGDVTGGQHATGRGGAIFNGNTQGMFPGVISTARNSVITGNKAKKGGGIYNDFGKITELAITISGNSATGGGGGLYNHGGLVTIPAVTISSNTAAAGGGIYNFSTDTGQDTPSTNGVVLITTANIQGNSARAGGGVFNRGLTELYDGSVVKGNFTTTGSSGETCSFAASNNTLPAVSGSCDGSGGGILSVHVSNASVTRFSLRNSVLSNNTAIAKGGGIFTVGVAEMPGNTINNNRAADGAAIYAVGPTDGKQQYCNFFGGNGYNSFLLHCNKTTTAGVGYGIVAGGSQGMFQCTLNSGALISGGNSSPRCQANSFSSNFPCPVQNPNITCPQP